MKTLVKLLLLIVMVAVPCEPVIAAANEFPETDSATGKNANRGSLLWEISGGGLERPSYLFGTMHLICPQNFKLHEIWITCFEKTGHLVLEVDFSDPGLIQEFQQGMIMGDGQTIQDLLTPDEVRLLAEFLADSMMMDLTHLSRIMPMILSTFFYTHLLQCQPASYDLTFMEMAVGNEYTITGLESIGDQLSIFKSIPYKEQAMLLIDMIKEYGQTRELYNRIADLYIDQDLDELYKLVLAESQNIPNFDETFLVARNINWVPEIKRLINVKPTFIAVGAGHLPGDEGLIKLLIKEGFNLRPIYPD